MCGILAVLGVADVSLAKRSRIIELSRRYGAAPHCLAVPSPSVLFVWLKRGPAPPRPRALAPGGLLAYCGRLRRGRRKFGGGLG